MRGQKTSSQQCPLQDGYELSHAAGSVMLPLAQPKQPDAHHCPETPSLQASSPVAALLLPQILYKTQEEQQQRWKDRQEQQTSKTASGKDASSASASSTSSPGHGRTGGKHAKHDSKSQQTKDAAATVVAASDATAGAGAEGDGGDDLLDDGHEYKDHNGVTQ